MKPRLDDDVERWLRAHRDADQDPGWQSMLADLIDDYREHARLGLGLNEEIRMQSKRNPPSSARGILIGLLTSISLILGAVMLLTAIAR